MTTINEYVVVGEQFIFKYIWQLENEQNFLNLWPVIKKAASRQSIAGKFLGMTFGHQLCLLHMRNDSHWLGHSSCII